MPNESSSFAISRGFANLSKSLLVARKFCVPGVVFHMKEMDGQGGEMFYSTLFLWKSNFWAIMFAIGEINMRLLRPGKTKPGVPRGTLAKWEAAGRAS